ncbi:hypothetical protein PIB30_042966 [Stylosanthes scabra]|uniref:FAR1 domain-containing protein n=1 Tax=Stylosanthes scabra TaxID=79078 RepID=A0ABU6QF10_9FABA|nr:hypothetical protein [Stylosanthes scabra]
MWGSDFEDSDMSNSDFLGMPSDKEFSKEEEEERDEYENVKDGDQAKTKRIAKLSREDIMQLEFTEEDAVHRFYKTYAMIHGFDVRLDEVRCDNDGCIIMRQIVCNRGQGRKKLKRMKEVGTTG